MSAHGFLAEDVLDWEHQIGGSLLNFAHNQMPLLIFFLVDGEVGLQVSFVPESYDF